MSRNSLIGTLPETFKHLVYLKKFTMYSNAVKGYISSESFLCQLRDYKGGSLNELWLDCDDFDCECCTKVTLILLTLIANDLNLTNDNAP